VDVIALNCAGRILDSWLQLNWMPWTALLKRTTVEIVCYVLIKEMGQIYENRSSLCVIVGWQRWWKVEVFGSQVIRITLDLSITKNPKFNTCTYTRQRRDKKDPTPLAA